MTDTDPLREALEKELALIGGDLPICPDWMYTAIRHCQRNMDIGSKDGFNEPDRQAGGSFARLANLLPEIVAALATLSKPEPAAVGEAVIAMCVQAVAGERLDAEDSHPEDLAYNRAIDDALSAIEALYASPVPSLGATLKYLLACVEAHADKFPVPSDMRSMCADVRATYIPSPSEAISTPDAQPLTYDRMGSGGRCDFKQLREAVSEATCGVREDRNPPNEWTYPGHTIVGGINYNSLDRIVTAFVDAALLHRSPDARAVVEADTFLAQACSSGEFPHESATIIRGTEWVRKSAALRAIRSVLQSGATQ